MRKYLYLFILICIALTACEKTVLESESFTKSSLIYMIADNNLDYYAISNIKEMELGLSDDLGGTIYLFIDRNEGGKPSHPCLYEIKSDTINNSVTSTIIQTYKEQNTSDYSCLREVIMDVQKYCNSQKSELSRLVLWSHGTGWLPEGTQFNFENDRALLSFGLDNTLEDTDSKEYKEMDIKDLTKALKDFHFELLIMDACFMGCIEVAYELKDHFDQMILSPSEILANGFPYKEIVNELISNKVDAENIANSFYNSYFINENALQSATIAIINSNYLNRFSEEIKNIYEAYSTLEKKQKDYLMLIPQYDRTTSNYFFDLKTFMTQIAHFVDYDTENIEKIWDKMVPYYAHTPKMFSTLELSGTTGLSVYIPNNYNERTFLHEYYQTLKWAKDCNLDDLFN